MDAFEQQARAICLGTPICDLGSSEGIKIVAIGLRETWRMATEAAEEKQRLLEQTIRNSADMISGAHARAEIAESKVVGTQQSLQDMTAAARHYEDLYRTAHGTVARIWEILGSPTYAELEGRTIYDLVRESVADAKRYRYLKEACSSHYPMTWEQPAEWSIGWEFQQRTPEEAFGSFDKWVDRDIEERERRQAKANENDGLEECGNWSASDPVKVEGCEDGF